MTHTVLVTAVCLAWMLFGKPRISNRNAAMWARLFMCYGFVRINRLLY